MFLLWHPWLTTTNLSYSFPLLETSATALCGTTGTCSSKVFTRTSLDTWHVSILTLENLCFFPREFRGLIPGVLIIKFDRLRPPIRCRHPEPATLRRNTKPQRLSMRSGNPQNRIWKKSESSNRFLTILKDRTFGKLAALTRWALRVRCTSPHHPKLLKYKMLQNPWIQGLNMMVSQFLRLISRHNP